MQTPSVDQLVGRVLGTYRLERLLGRGRLNAVYLASHLETQKHVALTLLIIPEQYAPDVHKRFTQRFYKEAATLTALQHPHILPVHEYGEYAGYPYLVTPYMMNGSLADLLKQEGRFSHGEVLDILEQVVPGLAYAHRKGVVHGTLKPANIVLSKDQKMQVAGLGLMHIQQMRGIAESDHPLAHLLSVAGTFLVSPEYSAPEVVKGQVVDTRSDVYAVGIICFELLSGQPPFTGTNPIEVANMHVKQPVPLLRTLHPDVPVAVASVVNQALARDPARRFQSVEELLEAFAQASWGATGPLQAAAKETTRSADQTGYKTSASRSTADKWQLLPPIVTGKLSTVTPPVQASSARKAPVVAPAAHVDSGGEMTIANPRSSSRVDPEVATGMSLPRTKAVRERRPPADPQPLRLDDSDPFIPAQSERRSTDPATFVPPRSVQKPAVTAPSAEEQLPYADDWWSKPPQEPLFEPRRESKKRTSQLLSPRRSPAPRKRGRRKVIAFLAAGSVAAAGAAIVLNTNLLQKTIGALPAPNNNAAPITMNGQNGQNAQDAPNMQPTNTQPQGAAGHTGTVIGMKNLTPNTSLVFNNPADAKPSLLIHLASGTFVAYEQACTHENVNVEYDPATQMLVCPAHGAMFDPANKAAVTQGPATRPLTTVPIRVNADGTITT